MASVTVRVDTLAPAVALTSPTADLTTTDASVTLTGTVSDAGSGLGLVQCNGVAATVDQGVASCTVPLRPGRNAVVLLARDAAGHVTSQGLRVTRTGPAAALTLTPDTRTLLVDEAAALSLLDDYGVAVADATWTSSDPAIVELSADDPPVVTAVAAGTATITAAKAGLSATATVTVVAGTSLPDGTTRWRVAPAATGSLDRPLYPHRVDETVPDLFAVETDENRGTVTLRALAADGTALWTEAAPAVPVMGDNEGAVVGEIPHPVTANPIGLASSAPSPRPFQGVHVSQVLGPRRRALVGHQRFVPDEANGRPPVMAEHGISDGVVVADAAQLQQEVHLVGLHAHLQNLAMLHPGVRRMPGQRLTEPERGERAKDAPGRAVSPSLVLV